MHGGNISTKLDRLHNTPDIDQIKMKNIDLIDDIKIKTNTSLNENKIIKDKNQSSDYLIEYFEGIIKNYINLYESRGENMDELKKIMFNNKEKNIIKGGETEDIYKKNDYTNDALYNTNIIHFNNDINWGTINIKFIRCINSNPRVYKIFIWHADNNNTDNSFELEIEDNNTDNSFELEIEDNNTDNSFNLEIDFINNTIGDHYYRIFNNDICSNSPNITKIFETIIQKLIQYEYNNFNNNQGINLHIYDGNTDITPTDGSIMYTIYKSIVSTLIMIFTIRNDVSTEIFKKYNNTFLLSSICKYHLLRNLSYDYNNCLKIFTGNNENLLTYSDNQHFNNVMSYYGDCALNTLICKRNSDIRELLLTKINHIDNNMMSTNGLDYFNRIKQLLDSFVIVGDINYPQKIKEYVGEYYSFINKIKGVEFHQLKNDVNNLNIKLLYNKIINIKNTTINNVDDYINIINIIFNYIRDSNKYIFDDHIININETCLNIINACIETYKLSNYRSNNINIKMINNYINNYIIELKTYIDNNIKNIINYNNIQDLFNNLKKFINVLRNNLLDYKLDNEKITLICSKIDEFINKFDKKINNNTFININFVFNNIKNEVDVDCLNNLVDVINYFINDYNSSLDIFYINILISLLLIKYKIEYIFDEDIMKIIKHLNNKENIINCFRNVCQNCYEIERIFPEYQEFGNEKYLFMYTILRDSPHAVLSIIHINSNRTRKIYLYDINTLNIYCSEYMYKDNIKGPNNYESDSYILNNNDKTMLVNKFNNEIQKHYRNNINIYMSNIMDVVKYYDEHNLLYEDLLLVNHNLKDIYDDLGNFVLLNLIKYDYDFYNKYFFDQCYVNIKRKLFENIVNYCKNEIYKNFGSYRILIYAYIYDYIQRNIINDNKCTMKNVLFKFIECLIKAKLKLENKSLNINNLNYEYYKIKDCFIETYKLDYDKFKKHLSFNDDRLNIEINNVLDIITFKLNKQLIFGSNINTNCNNSIIKKVLIILLIVLIIIIIVLIVLYIINKYKNKNNFK